MAAKLKADGIEAVVSTLNDFQVVALIDDLVKIDYNKQITILGTDTLKTTDMIKETGKVGAFYATSIVLEASEFAGGRKFLDAYQAAFKVAPAYGGHYTYDATYILAAAIKRANSADPAKVTEVLRKIDGFCTRDRLHEVGRKRRAALRRGQCVQGQRRALGKHHPV